MQAAADRGGGSFYLVALRVEAREAFNDFGQHVVERTQDPARVGVMASFKLSRLCLVALGAVRWSHDRGDQ